MKKPKTEHPFELPDSLWEAINERLWHATSPQGLKGILEAGEIRIIGNRCENSLCRHLDCVSLFDFGPTAKDCDGQYTSWWGWFGDQQKSAVGVWLEIDRDAAANKIREAGAMHEIFANNPKQFIPGVEAGHQGPIPLSLLKGALLIDQHDLERFERFEEVDETLIWQIDDFEARGRAR